MTEKEKFLPLALLLALAAIWGSSFLLIKRGLEVFSATEVGALRVVAASLFLLPLSLTRLRRISGSDHLKLAASGLMGILIPSFLFATAQTRLDSSVTGIMNSLTPIWAIVVGALAGAQRFTRYAVLGTLIGFVGVTLLVTANASDGVGAFNSYALLIVLATFFYGVNLNFIKLQTAGMDAITITSMSTFLIGILAATYLFGFTHFLPKLEVQQGALRAFGFVALLGFMSTAVAMLLLNKLIKISSPLYASFTTYLIPVVAIMLGWLDGEQLNHRAYLGMIAIVGGVYLTHRK